MVQIEPIQTADGVIYVQIADATPVAAPRARQGTAMPDGAEATSAQTLVTDTLTLVRQQITTVSTLVAQAFDKSAPDEWSVEISIGFKGKATPVPFLASGEADAALKIVAKWKKSSAGTTP